MGSVRPRVHVEPSGNDAVLGGFDDDSLAESFGLSRDGKRLVIATLEQTASLMAVENLPGVEPPAGPPR